MSAPTPDGRAPIQFDLNEGLSKALIDKFFEPATVVVGVDPSGFIRSQQVDSPLAIVAGLMYDRHAREITDQLWQRIDQAELVDMVADKVAASVVRAYTERQQTYGSYSVTPEQKRLHERVLEIVAQTLGQRVVDQMDLHLSPRPAVTDGGDRL